MKVIITLIIIIKRYFPIFVKCIHYLFIFIALITFLLSVLFLTLIIYVDSLQAIMNMDPIDYVFNKIAELKRPITFNYDSDTYCSSSEVASSSSESASGSNIPNADLPRTRTDLVGGALIEGSVPISDMTHNIVLPSRPNDPIAVSGNFDATQLLEHTEPLSTEDKRSFFTQILGKLDEQRQQWYLGNIRTIAANPDLTPTQQAAKIEELSGKVQRSEVRDYRYIHQIFKTSLKEAYKESLKRKREDSSSDSDSDNSSDNDNSDDV